MFKMTDAHDHIKKTSTNLMLGPTPIILVLYAIFLLIIVL